MSDQEFTEFLQKIDAGVRAGAASALDEHRRLGRTIAIWQDDKIVTLTDDEIPAGSPVNSSPPQR